MGNVACIANYQCKCPTLLITADLVVHVDEMIAFGSAFNHSDRESGKFARIMNPLIVLLTWYRFELTFST